MKKMKYLTTPLIIVLAVFSAAWLDPYRDAVTDGNDEFHAKKYHGAKRYYRKAERYAPGQDEKKKLSFNSGDAEYMLEDYESAVSEFQRAVQSEDREVQKKAFFNIGNAHVKQGNYREAVEAYINALKLDPNYLPAKKNLEYLLKRKEKKDDESGNDRKGDKKKDDGKGGDPRKGADREKGARKPEGGQGSRGENKMNPEQIKNILRSLEKSPVRRQKGGPDERRTLEKDW